MTTLFEIAGDCRYLSDTELLYHITNNQQVAEKYNEQLKRNEKFSLEDLLADLTPGRRAVVAAAVEMYKRTMERTDVLNKVMCSNDIYKLMYPLLCDLPNEEFWVLLLNQAQRVIKRVRLSIGGIDGTYADVRLLLKQAVMNNASSIVVIHNHPSGETEPSVADKRLTQQIKQAGETLNIRLIDHLIIGDKKHFSFADEGLM